MKRFLRTKAQRKGALITILALIAAVLNVVAIIVVARDFNMLDMYHRVERTPIEWVTCYLLWIEFVAIAASLLIGAAWIISWLVEKIIKRAVSWINRGA